MGGLTDFILVFNILQQLKKDTDGQTICGMFTQMNFQKRQEHFCSLSTTRAMLTGFVSCCFELYAEGQPTFDGTDIGIKQGLTWNTSAGSIGHLSSFKQTQLFDDYRRSYMLSVSISVTTGSQLEVGRIIHDQQWMIKRLGTWNSHGGDVEPTDSLVLVTFTNLFLVKNGSFAIHEVLKL